MVRYAHCGSTSRHLALEGKGFIGINVCFVSTTDESHHSNIQSMNDIDNATYPHLINPPNDVSRLLAQLLMTDAHTHIVADLSLVCKLWHVEAMLVVRGRMTMWCVTKHLDYNESITPAEDMSTLINLLLHRQTSLRSIWVKLSIGCHNPKQFSISVTPSIDIHPTDGLRYFQINHCGLHAEWVFMNNLGKYRVRYISGSYEHLAEGWGDIADRLLSVAVNIYPELLDVIDTRMVNNSRHALWQRDV